MRIEAVIKQVGELHEGKSKVTGKDWKAVQLLLEWEGEEEPNRAWATMFNEVVEAFAQTGLCIGDSCVAILYFSARTFRTGYHKTDICVNLIRRK